MRPHRHDDQVAVRGTYFLDRETGPVVLTADGQDIDAGPDGVDPDDILPLRNTTVHLYVSTYCQHQDHRACRLTCKLCSAECLCPCHRAEPR